MATGDFKLKYQIVADAAKAKAEIRDVDDLLGRLGGTAGAAFGGLGSGAAIAGTAVLAVGAAAVSTGAALFNLTKQASDFGSEIFDASKKTGLGAEALSSMKFAADQSGSSMEQITAGVAKFAKTVGAASESAKKGAAFLRDFGITPQAAIADLDSALDKVFKRIQSAPPGIERMTLAQKAFGRSGADLLPFLDSFDGDLGKLIRKAKELGVTIDDEAARAADEFGDQLDTLSAQLAGVGRTIGQAFMPQFMAMAKATSDWATQNKDEINTWALGSASAFESVIQKIRAATKELMEFRAVQQLLGIGQTISETLTGLSIEDIQKRGRAAAADQAKRAEQDQRWDAMVKLAGGKKLPAGSGDDSDGGSGRRSGAGRGLAGNDLLNFFEKELGLDVTSAGRAAGRKVAGTDKVSLHSVRPFQAVDVKVNDIKGYMQAGNQAMFERVARAIDAGFRFVEERDKAGSPHGHFESRKDAKASAFASIHTGKNYFTPEQLAYLQDLDAQRVGKTAAGKFEAFGAKAAEEELEEVKRVYQDYLDWLEQQAERRLDIRRAEAEVAVEIIEGQVDQGILIEKEAFERLAQLKLDMLREERAEIEKLEPTEENLHRLQMLDLAIQKQIVANERERNKLIEKRLGALRSWNKMAQSMGDAGWDEAKDDYVEAAAYRRAQSEKKQVTAPGTWGGGIASGMGVELVPMWKTVKDEMGNQVDVMMTQGERMKAIYADVADFAGSAIGSMVDGLAQMATAWIVTGEFSAQAALQMMASTAISIAFQAGMKALFEVAEGLAALARYDPISAGNHFAAAKVYGVTAAIAGGAGVGLALGARAAGGGGGKGSGGSSGRDAEDPQFGRNINKNPDPFSRETQFTYTSGRDQHAWYVARAIEKLEAKISGMSPGDVLTAGANQKRGFISDTVIREGRGGKSTAINKMLRNR